MKTIKIKRITNIGTGRVINLNVKRNHTFVTENGIPTHNCDHLTPDTQAALRDFIETVHNTTRFVVCANYGDKITPEFKSRFRVVEMLPPPGKEIFKHLEYILKSEGIRYKKETLVDLIKKCYPDVRQTIISLQENVINGVLPEYLVITTINDVYDDILKAMLTGNPDNVRKLLRSHHIDYTALYKYIYDKIMDSADDDLFANDVGAILLVGEHSHKDNTSCIKEINFMEMFFKMLSQGVI
jgi:DNA polymerase III delta prime subunit